MPVRRGARAVPQLPLLTLGLMGGQCVWSTEMAFAGPFLLHLGMSKSHMSAVFVAGPLSGLLVQPSIGKILAGSSRRIKPPCRCLKNLAWTLTSSLYARSLVLLTGLISDASTSRWGRRRPLLLLSTTICAFSLLQLGFARPMASIISSDADTQTTATTALAVLSIFTIDFSVNAVQALDRALLIDLVPMHLQAAANAWCARLAGVGAIIGFLIGQTDLTDLAPFRWVPSLTAVAPGEGDATEAQLRCISMLVAFLLLVTQAVTMAVAKEQPVWQEEERDTQMTADSTKGNNRHCCASLQGVMSMFSDLIATGRSMSRPMIDLLRIQLFLSSAWYPVCECKGTLRTAERRVDGNLMTRLPCTVFYSTTWVAQIALHTSSITPASAMRLGSLAMLIHAILSIVCTLVLPPVLAHFAHGNRCGRKYDALTLSWSLSTFLLSFALFCTWWASKVNSMHSSVAIIALTGLPWAFSAWVPFTLVRCTNSNSAEVWDFLRTHLTPADL